MARLNIQRQLALEPKRMEYAKKQIELLGYEVKQVSDTELQFTYMGRTVNFFPYSGWAGGSTIKNGRGLKKLLSQLK